jgi:hypothetical protein
MVRKNKIKNREKKEKVANLSISPKREKMISRSSPVVTGFSLQTNKTFSGGATSALGRSPIISSTVALALASLSAASSASCSAVLPSSSPSSSSRVS